MIWRVSGWMCCGGTFLPDDQPPECLLSQQQLHAPLISSLSHTDRSIEDTSDIRSAPRTARPTSYRRIVVKSVKAEEKSILVWIFQWSDHETSVTGSSPPLPVLTTSCITDKLYRMIVGWSQYWQCMLTMIEMTLPSSLDLEAVSDCKAP